MAAAETFYGWLRLMNSTAAARGLCGWLSGGGWGFSWGKCIRRMSGVGVPIPCRIASFCVYR